VSGPYETEDQVLADPAVQSIYARMRASREYRMQDGSAALLLAACEQAGVQLGEYDARIVRWLAGFEPQSAAVVAGIITRAGQAGRPGPHSVTFDLAGDDGTTYLVLQTALEDFATWQRGRARPECDNDQYGARGARAEAMLADVEAAMDGKPGATFADAPRCAQCGGAAEQHPDPYMLSRKLWRHRRDQLPASVADFLDAEHEAVPAGAL
jgi:hypothetical protein